MELLEHLARTPVELLAASDEQQVVGGLLGESMLEDILEFGIMYPLAHQLLVGQHTEVGLYILDALGRRCRCAADCRQCSVLKDPAEDGGCLGNVFGVLW